ncbi:hypothetical protein PENTCL1PPCAC_19175, partial [Pristionchus entomophagus]
CRTGDKTLCCKHVDDPVWANSCEWVGSAWFCGNNDCPEGKTELRRSGYEEDGIQADFGDRCWTGKKTLCCN